MNTIILPRVKKNELALMRRFAKNNNQNLFKTGRGGLDINWITIRKYKDGIHITASNSLDRLPVVSFLARFSQKLN